MSIKSNATTSGSRSRASGSEASALQLLGGAPAIARAFEESCDWADEILLCTPALDTNRGKWPLWHTLSSHLPKLRQAYVALDGLRTEPDALERLYHDGCLRLVAAADGSFRVNLLRFRRGDRVRFMLGAGMLCPPGMMASVDAMVLWEGERAAPFSLQVETLLSRVRLKAHVPERTELDEYARTYFDGQESWDRLVELGAPFIREASHDAELPALELVEDGKSVRKAIRILRAIVKQAATSTASQSIGFQGGNLRASVHWIAPLRVWCVSQTLTRHWNAFGVDRPDADRSLPATVEINVPLEGIDRKVGGALGRDPVAGDIYLLHRGRIGGGQKGVGSELFWRRFRGGVLVRESDREEPSRVVVVGKLGTPEFLRDLAAFVHEVARIKKAAR
ncbi:hypothetical protein WME94_26820 [Sorangium sp. So ce429]